MGKLDEFLDRARDLAEDAEEAAKNIAGEVADRANKLTDERSKVRELTQNAREQTSAFTLGAREKVQGVIQDVKAGKDLRQGISELEAMPEIEGSIIYRMELETMINSLNSLLLIIDDGRLDDASVVEEIRKVMDKVQPAADPQAEDAAQQMTDEQKAIEEAKSIAYNACVNALGSLNASSDEA